jgi:hypothetical protein
MTAAVDAATRTAEIGDAENGVDLLIAGEGDRLAVDLAGVGSADIVDEGVAAIRLDRTLAAKLATVLAELAA